MVRTTLFLIALSISAQIVASSAMAEPDVFESPSVARDKIPYSYKWKRVVSLYHKEPKKGLWYRDWSSFLELNRSADKVDQLDRVNRYFNRFSYMKDEKNWKRRDYWAIPKDLISKQRGDCEDYAIGKYFSLKVLGWSDDQLRIFVVASATSNVPHALLVAQHEGVSYILDNRRSEVKKTTEEDDYAPMYSMNESGSWEH